MRVPAYTAFMISLIVLLGNPGSRYEKTRHNAARMLEEYLPFAGELVWQEKFKGRYAPARIGGEKRIFLKPETFMNLSGESVQAAARFFRVSAAEICVVHDELEMPFGAVEFRKGGGLGGHNGLRSIDRALGTREFHRLRLGIGRPDRQDVSSWVLSRFAPDEEPGLERMLSSASELLLKRLEET